MKLALVLAVATLLLGPVHAITAAQQQALIALGLLSTTTTIGQANCSWTIRSSIPSFEIGGSCAILMCNNQSDLVEIKRQGFCGDLRSEIGNFTELTTIDMLVNSGSIPSQIGLLTKLTTLRIDSRFSVSFDNSLPTQIGLLNKLQTIDLVGAQAATGTIPTQIGRLNNLLSLSLANFDEASFWYSGTIPTQIGQLSKLNSLLLRRLAVNGTFPWQYVANISSLRSLSLGNLSYTGTIPSIPRTNLTSVIIGYVDYTGHVPAWLQTIKRANSSNYIYIDNVPLICDNDVVSCNCYQTRIQPCSNFSVCLGTNAILCDYTPPPTPTPLVTPTPRPVSTKATTPKATTPTPTPRKPTPKPTPVAATPTPVMPPTKGMVTPTPVVTSPTMSPTPVVTPTPVPTPAVNDGTCLFDKCTSCVQSICTVNQIDFSHDIPADAKIVTQGVDMPAGTTMAWYVELDADGTWKCGTVVASQCVDMSGDIVLVISGNLTQDTIIDILISQNSCLNVNGSVSVGYAQSKRGVVSTVPSGCESVSATPQPSSSKFSVLLSSDTSKCQSQLKPEFVIPIAVGAVVVVLLVIVAFVIVQLRAKNKLLKRLSELQSTDKHSTMTTIAE